MVEIFQVTRLRNSYILLLVYKLLKVVRRLKDG